jgi:DNA-binding CsgD family transcriptional regulator
MNTDTNNNERSAIELLQEINSGMTDPKSLDKQSRQRCVELLIAEGYSYAHVGQVLKCSEKTISRDIKNIRERNALVPNVEFAKQFIGTIFQKSISHHGFLVRVARSKDVSASEKIQAEYAAWKILKDTVDVFQSLGYLPLKPKELTGDLYHHLVEAEGGESVKIVKDMISEIESIARETNTYNAELENDIKAINLRIEKAEIVSDVKKITKKQEELQNKEESNDGSE